MLLAWPSAKPLGLELPFWLPFKSSFHPQRTLDCCSPQRAQVSLNSTSYLSVFIPIGMIKSPNFWLTGVSVLHLSWSSDAVALVCTAGTR